jgi:translation initiation factor IF-1
MFVNFHKSAGFPFARVTAAIFFVVIVSIVNLFEMPLLKGNKIMPVLAQHSVYTFDMQDRNILCKKVSNKLQGHQKIRILNEDSVLVATLKEFEISFQIEGC